jgi:hypothetical protein
MSTYLDTLTAKAHQGFIAGNYVPTPSELKEMVNNGFKVKELADEKGTYNITWSESDKVQPSTLRKHAYDYWKKDLYAKAEKKAKQGCFVLDLTNHNLVTNGSQYFEVDGFQVDTNETKITAFRWERMTKGKAESLRNIARSSGKIVKKFVSREGLLEIPRCHSDMTKVFRLQDDIEMNDVEAILKDKFPHVKIKRIARDDTYYAILYLG